MATTRKIGLVTTSAAVGGGVGVAIAQISVWGLAQLHIDATPIETPLGIVFTALGAVIGGWIIPTPKQVTPSPSEPEPDNLPTTLPPHEGRHVA